MNLRKAYLHIVSHFARMIGASESLLQLARELVPVQMRDRDITPEDLYAALWSADSFFIYRRESYGALVSPDALEHIRSWDWEYNTPILFSMFLQELSSVAKESIPLDKFRAVPELLRHVMIGMLAVMISALHEKGGFFPPLYRANCPLAIEKMEAQERPHVTIGMMFIPRG